MARLPPPPPPGFGLIDSHAHLDHHLHGPHVEESLRRAWDGGLGGIVAVAAAGRPEVFAEVAALVAGEPRLAMTAGIHPHDADREDLLWPALREVLESAPVRAVGETGLDFHYDHSSRPGQERCFRRHVEEALARDLPLVLHVREAHREALELLDGFGRGAWSGVVHCFTGGPGEAEDWLERGFYLSIPGVVTFPGRGALADAVLRIPADRLLVETDSPYLAPVPLRGRRNEPANVVWTAAEVASLRGVPYKDLVPVLAANARRLFCLP
ncbi:MAG: TatD family hydrolase [Deltaproteobacteria bacterium]|nr:TatD family hydrolase [Deltaproteobacteria bacterium]